MEVGQNVKQKLIKPFATVHLGCRVILSFPALRLGVHLILNAHPLKYVITLRPHLQRKNVNLFVRKIHALLEHLVKQIIIVKSVLVIIHYKETVMSLVLNVSESRFQPTNFIIIFKLHF